MTDIQRFTKLKQFILDDDVDVEVDTSYYEQAKTPKQDRIINGTAGADSYIILYKDSKESNYNMLCSLLIHEYGHVVNWRDLNRDKHTEKDAWKVGVESVPKELIPHTIKEDCALCMSSYNVMNVDWMDALL
tara:strand:+ start:43 stop:438 length:396 start_codon:yes stop_codon:yes gene_type:complete